MQLAGVTTNVRLAFERLARYPAPRRRVEYIGGEGGRNLGDDAMFEVCGRLLPAAAVLSMAYPAQEVRLARLGLSGRRFFHAGVLGGGTLINPYWLQRVRLALSQGIRFWALGTGVGSAGLRMPERVDVSAWKPVLDRFEGIGVRGPLSLAALEDVGVRHAEVIGDLALHLTWPTPAPPAPDGQYLLNATAHHAARDRIDYEAAEAALADLVRALQAAGRQAVPVAMHPSDVAPLRRLLARAGLAAAPIHQPSSAAAFFHLAAACDFCIAVRLHAAILCCCLGIPPLMLGYRTKCLDFMTSMHLQAWHLDLATEVHRIHASGLALSHAADALRGPVHRQALRWQAAIAHYTTASGLADACRSAPRPAAAVLPAPSS